MNGAAPMSIATLRASAFVSSDPFNTTMDASLMPNSRANSAYPNAGGSSRGCTTRHDESHRTQATHQPYAFDDAHQAILVKGSSHRNAVVRDVPAPSTTTLPTLGSDPS